MIDFKSNISKYFYFLLKYFQEPAVGDGRAGRGGGEDSGRLPGQGEGGHHTQSGQV